MHVMLLPEMLVGLGAVAVWAHFRYPKLRPHSLVQAALHIVVSFGAFALLPLTLSVVLPSLPSHGLRPYVVLALLIPMLTYLLLSWVWLLARIVNMLDGTPRGGLPASNES